MKEVKDLSSPLAEILAEFKEKFGYELSEKNDDCDYVIFKRTVNGNENHNLILEDHRWESGLRDFDPGIDVGDWLIFSMVTNSERDWFGRFIETQYPLTYSEYKFIEKIISELEKVINDEDGLNL